MKSKELREWLFQHSLEDRWYLTSEGHLFQEIFSIKEVEEFAKCAPGASFKILHLSNNDMESPPWVDFELEDAKAAKASSPRIQKRVQPVVPAPASRQVAFTRTQPQTWRERQAQRRTSSKAVGQSGSGWTLEKIVGLATVACVGVICLGLVLSYEPASPTSNSGDESTRIINSRDAYYAAQPFVKGQVQSDYKVQFPSDSAAGVFHEQVRDGLYKMAGFVRLEHGGSSKFEGYNMITRHLGDDKWELVYLKMGPTVVGSIPSNLSGDERAFVAKR